VLDVNEAVVGDINSSPKLPPQVRPSFVEAAVQRRATSSVAHHLLVNYQRAHIAIIKAQFTSKRLRDGMEVRTHGQP
jgi:hypothetical protein